MNACVDRVMAEIEMNNKVTSEWGTLYTTIYISNRLDFKSIGLQETEMLPSGLNRLVTHKVSEVVFSSKSLDTQGHCILN